MANLRLIKIVQVANGAAFKPGNAGVNAGDRVHWNNETDEDHWLERTNPTGFLTNNIPAGQVSNPGVVVQDSGTMEYRCKLHPQETGMIVPIPVLVPALAAASALTSTAASAGKAKAPRMGARKKSQRKKASRRKTK